MSVLTPSAALRGLFVALSLGVAGCASMMGPERSAYVVFRPASATATALPLTGPTKEELTKLLARHSYRYSPREDAAMIAYVEVHPSATDTRTNTYILTKVVRNPNSRHVRVFPPDPTSIDRQHPSLSMLEHYERAEQSRPAGGP